MPDVELNTKEKIQRTKTIIRSAFFGFLALFFIGISFIWEQGNGNFNDSFVSTIKVEGNRIDVPGNAYFVSEQPDVSKILKVEEISKGDYVVNMEEGRVWGDFGYSFDRVNVNIGGKIVVIPSFSNFDVSYDEGIVTLSSYIGNTYVGFVPDKLAKKEYHDEHSRSFGNVLLVPAGVRVKIMLSRIDDRFTKLLSSKLEKECSYSFIPSKFYEEEEFVKNNLKDSFSFAEDFRKLKKSQFNNAAPQGLSSNLSDFLHENLTVFQSKEDEYYMSKLSGFLYKAVLTEDSAIVDENLNNFKSLVQVLPKNVLSGNMFKNFVTTWLSNVVAFGGDEQEYKILETLINVSENLFDKTYLLAVKLSRFNNSIYNDENVDKAFVSYYQGVEKLFKFTDDSLKYKKFLSFYNEVLDNLLLRFPEVYKEDYFVMKGKLESELYSLYYGGQDKEELKQSFVMRKIDFLKNLKKFFFAEEVSLDDARGVMKTLVQEVNDYMPAKTSKVAVLDLFAQQLSDVGDFWGYINDVEYSKSTLYGGTHKERYAVYLKEKDQVMSILDVQSDILGSDAVSNLTTGDILLSIRNKLISVGATSVKVETLSNVHQRFVKISAVLGGHVFDAEYDRDYEMVRNIYAYGSLLSDSSMKVESLKNFLTSALEQVAEKADVKVVDGASAETNAQKIAKTIIAKKLVELGFNVMVEQVEILDPVNALYRIKNIEVKGNGAGSSDDSAGGSVGSSGDSAGPVAVSISFDYLANDEDVQNLFVLRNGEGINVSGKFPLDQLKGVVLNGKY